MNSTIKKHGKIIFRSSLAVRLDSHPIIYAVSFNDNPQDAEWQLYSYEEEKLYPAKFTNVYRFYNEMACVVTRSKPQYQYNFVNKKAELIFPIDFDSVEKTLFIKPVMGAFVNDKHFQIAITGGINATKKELAKLLLEYHDAH